MSKTETTNETTNETETARIAALAAFLECDIDDISEDSDDTFSYGRAEYRVLTDSEADAACAEYVEDSLWAFNADFLSGATGFDSCIFSALAEKCETANPAIVALVRDSCGIAALVSEAIGADGRGHFLAGYDGEENESGAFYIYRTN